MRVSSRKTREYTMQSFGRGQAESAIEFLAPRRDKGTRILKQSGSMWIYLPRAERTQQISGHMLRQGMMGSDISYEDMMDAADFVKKYDAEVVGEEEVEGRSCWKLEAKAKNETVTYPRRVIWIDKEWKIPTRQELYAVSGMMLKTWSMSDVKKIDQRWVPHRMTIADRLREGSKTELIFSDIKFGVDLEEEVFSRRWLERR
jgi:outer membrane lipoprotein-sorting protein